jgi:hypothetical protein
MLRCGVRDVIDYIVADGDAMSDHAIARESVP